MESGSENKEVQELRVRTEKALELIARYGGTYEERRRAWFVDQAVRALLGCPIVLREGTYVFGESEEYREFVRKARDGEDGPETYEWDIGIVP